MVCLFPAVVWALDDTAETYVRGWENALSPDTRTFVRVARDAAEVRAGVRDLSRKELASELAPLGILLPATNRLQVALVADMAGTRTADAWRAAEDLADKIEGQVVSVERVRIGLFITHDQLAEPGVLTLEGLKGTPWLLSTRLESGHQWSSAEFKDHFRRLLNGLLFLDRDTSGGQEASVLDEGEAGQVKVYGFPREDPRGVVEALQSLARRALIQQLSLPPSPAAAHKRDRLRTSVRRFQLGQCDDRSLLAAVLGTDGLGSWTARELIASGPEVVSDIERDLQSPLVTTPVTSTESPEPSLWQRLKKAIALLIGRHRPAATPPPAPNVHAVPTRPGTDLLVRRLRRAGQILGWWRVSHPSTPLELVVPPEFLQEWEAALEAELRDKVRSLSEWESRDED
jgi:hypothetical protein